MDALVQSGVNLVLVLPLAFGLPWGFGLPWRLGLPWPFVLAEGLERLVTLLGGCTGILQALVSDCWWNSQMAWEGLIWKKPPFWCSCFEPQSAIKYHK